MSRKYGNNNNKVFGLTYLTKSWYKVHIFSAPCVHCIEAKVDSKRIKYESLDALIYHFVKHHLREYRYKCIYAECEDEYSSYKQLLIHMVSHSECDLNPYKCAECDYNYCASSKAKLIQHIADFHFINVIDETSIRAYPVLAGTIIRPQQQRQMTQMRKRKKAITRPNTKHLNIFNAPGIPRLRTKTGKYIEREASISRSHSIIFPYFECDRLIPNESTDSIAESGFYDDCVPPLIIAIVPSAFKASLHNEYTVYNEKYCGNPIKKPFYKSHDEISWRLDEPRDPHFKYHKEMRLPPTIVYAHPKYIEKTIKITPKLQLKVNSNSNEYKYWYKMDKGKMYVANKERIKRERMINKKRIYKENKQKWNRRRKQRRQRYMKRNKMVKHITSLNTRNTMDIFFIAAQNDGTDCTTCTHYDSY